MSPAARPAQSADRGERAVDRRLWEYVSTLAVATTGFAVLGSVLQLHPPAAGSWTTLPFLAAGMVAAEQLRVRFRRGDDVDALTLFEAVLAPLLFTFSPLVVVSTVAVAQTVTAVLRRSAWIKGAFNVAQWSLAAVVGSIAIGLLNDGSGVSLRSLAFLIAALGCVAVVNNVAFTVVLAISSRQSLPTVLRGLSPIIVPGWIGGWGINLLIGLLFVLADAGHPIAVVLFPVPLAVLHFAYRGYAAARADRLRLTGLRQAANVLSEPLHPRQAIDDFLREVAQCFESRSAALVLFTEAGDHEIHVLSLAPDRPATQRIEGPEGGSFEAVLAALQEPLRVRSGGDDELSAALAAAGWRDCLSAPLVDEHRQLGALAVFDQTGLEGTATADLAVLEALARETAHTIARGRLFENVLDERRKLAQIVSSTSDGIFTLSDNGIVLSWNAACERITGLSAGDVVGRRDAMRRLNARTASGTPVDFVDWAADAALPSEIVLTRFGDGELRRLLCSANRAIDVEARSETLVVVARDITPAEEHEQLREQFSRLVEVQAAQRLVVDHLQKAVAPEPPGIAGADIAVAYVASDPSSPTGGDLFDWHCLPSGELHVAVVDVLGHGVAATKDALTVVHTLRFVAVEGTPLEQVVERADQLLSAQDSELVATVMVARYRPETGELRVVSGGHPPALVVSATGEVTQLAATGGAIGWPAVGSDNVASTTLGINESLVLYTDGLIEARKDVLEGMDSLVRYASEVAHLPAAQFADELVQRSLEGAERRDDTLALVLRRTRVRTRPEQFREVLDPASATAVGQARHHLLEWLREEAGVSGDDPLLVAAELLSNAVVVARTSVVVTARHDGDRIILEVSDDGPGQPDLDERGHRLPPHDSESGRGLFLVRSLSEDVSVLSTAEGTVMRCVLNAHSPSRPGLTAGARRY